MFIVMQKVKRRCSFPTLPKYSPLLHCDLFGADGFRCGINIRLQNYHGVWTFAQLMAMYYML